MQHKSERAAPPYGDCIEHDTAERSLLLDKNYTMETCIASCVQRKTVEVRCGCLFISREFLEVRLRSSTPAVWSELHKLYDSSAGCLLAGGITVFSTGEKSDMPDAERQPALRV